MADLHDPYGELNPFAPPASTAEIAAGTQVIEVLRS
jgi:hypothetical protein